MPFKEGNDLGGRPEGAVNKTTKQLKEWFTAFSWKNANKMQKAFDKVISDNPAEGLRLWLQFSERVAPKLASSSVDVNAKTDNTIHFTYGDSFTPQTPRETGGVSSESEEV